MNQSLGLLEDFSQVLLVSQARFAWVGRRRSNGGGVLRHIFSADPLFQWACLCTEGRYGVQKCTEYKSTNLLDKGIGVSAIFRRAGT
jgi:hypothetical protein